MFKVNTGNHNVEFSFQHDPEYVNRRTKTKGVTIGILKVDGVAHLAEARCSQFDQFNKERGRKNALRKALEASGLTRDERREVWHRYHNRHVPNASYEDLGPSTGWAAIDREIPF